MGSYWDVPPTTEGNIMSSFGPLEMWMQSEAPFTGRADDVMPIYLVTVGVVT